MPRPKSTHCVKGHPYTPENIYLWRDKKFCRVCRQRWFQELPREAKQRRYRNAILWARKTSADLRARHNISQTDYDLMLAKQSGECWICSRKTKLFVDHDHKTGIIRGLLCQKCNSAIGFLRDDPALVDKAAAYLRRGTEVVLPRVLSAS